MKVYSNLNDSVILYGHCNTQTEAYERGSKSGMASPWSMSFTAWFRGRDKFKEWYQGIWTPSHFLLSEIIRILPTCLLAAIESQQHSASIHNISPKTAEGWEPPGPPNPLTATSKLWVFPRTYLWVFFRVCPAEKYSGIKLYTLFFFFKQTKPPSLTGKGRDGIRQTSFTDGSPFCLSACKCFLFWNYTVLTEPETAI